MSVKNNTLGHFPYKLLSKEEIWHTAFFHLLQGQISNVAYWKETLNSKKGGASTIFHDSIPSGFPTEWHCYSSMIDIQVEKAGRRIRQGQEVSLARMWKIEHVLLS